MSGPQGDDEQDDLSWLNDELRQSAVEMLEVLFASTRVCVITFDGDGTIVGVNPHTVAFDGQMDSKYKGINLLSNMLVRRIGWAAPIQRVLAGETVELTDSRWVTLFSREERFVDVIAGPVIVGGKVIGGIAYLIDATTKHRAQMAESANRRRARELEVFLARDVAKLVGALETWSRTQSPSSDEAAMALTRIGDLSSLLDDLLHFVQLGTYQPKLERVLLADAIRGLEKRWIGLPETDGVAVIADRRLLRRVLRNLIEFSARSRCGPWSLQAREGRVVIRIPVDASEKWLQALLVANPISAAEAASADDSLAAARWMAETLNGSLTATGPDRALVLSLPATDAKLA